MDDSSNFVGFMKGLFEKYGNQWWSNIFISIIYYCLLGKTERTDLSKINNGGLFNADSILDNFPWFNIGFIYFYFKAIWLTVFHNTCNSIILIDLSTL